VLCTGQGAAPAVCAVDIAVQAVQAVWQLQLVYNMALVLSAC
jgi:hypothetical protein